MKAVDAGFPSAQDPNRNIKEIDVSVQGAALDYAAADALADVLAMKVARDVMLVAWFDGKNDVGYPAVQECTGDTPTWLAYAESHDGNLGVNINGGEFVFVFATGLENQGG
jgi:hypothetical protein